VTTDIYLHFMQVVFSEVLILLMFTIDRQ